MKKKENEKPSKLLKNFEISKSKQSSLIGGLQTTMFTIPGSDASSFHCPDTKEDVSE